MNRHAKFLDGAGKSQAIGIHGRHMCRVSIDKQDLLPGACQASPDAAANRPRAPDKNGLGAHDHGPSISARVSSTATDQIACMSLSLRW